MPACLNQLLSPLSHCGVRCGCVGGWEALNLLFIANVARICVTRAVRRLMSAH